jgi:hypothetical protein
MHVTAWWQPLALEESPQELDVLQNFRSVHALSHCALPLPERHGVKPAQ